MNYNNIILQDQIFSLNDLKVYSERILLKPELPDWEKKIYRFILDFLDEKDYIFQQSSGTTGIPKIIKLKKTALIQSAVNTINKLNLKFKDKALLCLSTDYIAGKMMIIRSLIAGLNLYWEEPSSKPNLMTFGNIEFCAMVPLQVYNCITKNNHINNIRNLIIGGAQIPGDIMSLFREFDNNIYETFGMTETCSHIALRKINGKTPDKYFELLDGITISVDNRSCLIINTDYLESEIITNDVVSIIDNKHFCWKGRFDNLINSGGIKIFPEELEASITRLINLECAVLGVNDKILGQMIVLIIESSKEVDRDQLIIQLKKNIKSFMVPRKIYVTNNFPRTSTYKIDRLKLKDLINS